ncbi:EAL domain-containing protein [Pseudorhizobium marinum]|mgnify:FL=1|jgi:EAL domain-containing protein (putative c-di-GMP-specific phosphodiesterase class I)|uniref:EAL domain-containing protein n=1 Tax=Pseudorhizobium marinum TaxID=1496690 RepID=UPI000494F8F7|nr:EAL domain-containing protein [Pseudorhizobium marinum]MBU1316802.1 EAL domain-containing protein [Alphaproteobacteria bacterium]MBU1548279.1 EAL domain-containing protein [Alphaproteobacteria bacterium]MBU2335959.1 EAL domain-containing protein [Alphaproteobacteria bacterium]MBU2390646.1 EAL domain-containing protein [Alphaproteobacteria bacterium]|tara:strand:+ start:510 stop:1253 length:744 start_codon:yes stop_codon:yes gene_type:complete
MSCAGCRDGEAFDLPFSMAFQPIVDMGTGQAFAYEALVRGLNGEGAGTILSQVTDANRYAFDQRCRTKAIELAAGLRRDPATNLSINFMPNAVYEPRACIRMTLAAAARVGFPLDRIIFEFTESERVDIDHLLNILRTYKDMGFKTAIDDFGAGYSGLDLLAHFQPDIVKLDMDLIRGIDTNSAKQIVVKHTLAMLSDFGIKAVCEGVETPAEMALLQDMGVTLIQGYLLGRPTFEAFAPPRLLAVA